MNTYLTHIRVGEKILNGPEIKGSSYDEARKILKKEYNDNYYIIDKVGTQKK